jgi:hypothetical protein
MKTFISYKYGKPEHNAWVKQFAIDLKEKYQVNCTLDQLDAMPGVSLISFMQSMGSNTGVVLVIITKALNKSIAGQTGHVYYEVANAINLANNGKLKIIPILKDKTRLPLVLSCYIGVDFSNPVDYMASMEKLASAINTITQSSRIRSRSVGKNEVVVHQRGLSRLSDASIVADMTLEKTLAYWKDAAFSEDYDLSNSLLNLMHGKTDSEDVKKAKILEAIYFGVDPIIFNGVPNPALSELRKIRISAYAKILLSKKELEDYFYAPIIERCLNNLPAESFASELREIHSECPCTSETRVYWAAILDWGIGTEDMSSLPETESYLSAALFHIKSFNWSDPVGQEMLNKHFESSEAIHKVHAAFCISGWVLRGMLREEDAGEGNFRAVLECLMSMFRNRNRACRLAAANAILQIIASPLYITRSDLLDDDIKSMLVTEVFNPFNTSLANQYLYSIIGLLFQGNYSLRKTLSWFPFLPGSNDETSAVAAKNTPPSKLVDELFQVLSALQPNVRNAQLLAMALLRMGAWNESMTVPLFEYVFHPSTLRTRRDEAIVRLAQLDNYKGVPLLKLIICKKAPHVEPDLTYLAFAALVQMGPAISLADVSGCMKGYDKLDVAGIIYEANNLADDRLWRGSAALAFRSFLDHFYVSHMGHCIHKLKAKDTTGRWAYYFVLVEPQHEPAFLEAIAGDGTVDLEDYGRVVASCYGEKPTQEVRDYLKEKYNFDV